MAINNFDHTRKVRITPRDLDVLQAVYHYGGVRGATLHQVIFTEIMHRRHVHRPLFRLVKSGYLTRRLPPRIHRDSNDFSFPERLDTAYFITPQGADLLLYEGLIDEPEASRLVEIERLSSKMLAMLHHDLDVRDIRACLDLSLQNNNAIDLIDWCDENEKENGKLILETKVTIQTPNGKTRKFTHRPDACFTLQHTKTGIEKLFFVEVDLGTESGARRWRDKVLGYLAYRKQVFRAHFPDYQGDDFCLLTITRSRSGIDQQKRLDTLVARTLHTGGRHQFYFTTFRQIMPDNLVTGDFFLTKSVWQRSAPGEWLPPKERRNKKRQNKLQKLCDTLVSS